MILLLRSLQLPCLCLALANAQYWPAKVLRFENVNTKTGKMRSRPYAISFAADNDIERVVWTSRADFVTPYEDGFESVEVPVRAAGLLPR
jgi:hypothetical protein